MDNTVGSLSSLLVNPEDSYILGLRETEEKYNKLKLAFESLLDYWGDYGNYNASRNHMEEMWREEAGI
jgi:hypothetical protein